MRSCKSCGKQVPTRIVVDGVTKSLQNRKFCLLCSPYGKHNTKQKLDSPKQGDELVCVACNRSFVYNRRQGHTFKKCNSCFTKRHNKLLKIKSIEYKGGVCNSCGYNKCIDALDFHHVNQSTKKFAIGGSYNRNWASIKLELDKCELLCSNCHRERHSKG
jgi:hypothetical protein